MCLSPRATDMGRMGCRVHGGVDCKALFPMMFEIGSTPTTRGPARHNSKPVRESRFDMTDKLSDPRRDGDYSHWPPKQRKQLFRGMVMGKLFSLERRSMQRNWSVHTGIPVIKKTIQSMRSDNTPIRETVHIGDVCMVFAGSQLVGFSKGDTKLMLPSSRSLGLDWPEAETMSELVKRLYLALGEETTRQVEEWIDKDLG